MPSEKTTKKSKPSANGATRYLDRFIEALALLCGGAVPPRELAEQWELGTSEALQDWAVNHVAARWATGIGAIDAAQALANAPEEGIGHELPADAYPDQATGR